jgi:hypothetical protein
VFLFVLGAGAAVLAYLALPSIFAVSYSEMPAAAGTSTPVRAKKEEPKPLAKHLPAPESLKAIYMSQCVVGTPSFRESLVKFIDETELNAVVIDIKDYTGKISFTTENPKLKDSVSDACGARDMRTFIELLHSKNVFVIGRITVFQDPYYSSTHPELAVKRKDNGGTWKDRKGLAFIDVGAKPFWDYIIELGKESYEIGFDELNFDYVRFPSDGDMANTFYSQSVGKSKPQALEEFFEYLSLNLRPTGAALSADLFGMTTTNTDDLGIGQVLERALPYFDRIYPMVYPSHYPNDFNGWKDPNAYTYDLMKYVVEAAVRRTVAATTTVPGFTHTAIASTSPQLYEKPVYEKGKIVPWLQDFDYPVDYTPAMVRNQIQATYDAGLTSYIFWDAGNKYSSLRQVLSQ